MLIKPWKTISTKLIHETPWIEVKEDICEVDGKTITYTYNNRKDAGPLIIPEDTDGKLWMIQIYRHPIKKIIWQFPAEGKIGNETWEQTAQRGLEEEINKRAKTIIKIGQIHPDPGGIEQTAYFYLAKDLYNVSNVTAHDDTEVEDLEVKAFSLAEIETMIQKGDICDGWTLSALYLYQRQLKR